MHPAGISSMAARVDRGELQDAGVATSSRAGMNRIVKARPATRGWSGASGRVPVIQTFRRPFFKRTVVSVAVVTSRSASNICSSLTVLLLGGGHESRRDLPWPIALD